ncbi:MAG: serine/threonine protein kinase [Chloroflexi bacterium]|nr:serine/threonine protein kinase [Chloroflexota bacterium]
MPLALKTGEVLRARYCIRERIGQGGMGNIYLADDLRLEGRRCALKEVEHDRSISPKLVREAREQFMREATVLARLDHPNLPKVSDFFSAARRDYLVMDYVPGRDLRQLLQRARQQDIFLTEEDVLGWASQLADALTYLHRQEPPLVHRDIKPSNLKITPNGIVKLVDFGLVKVLAPEEMTVTVIQGRGTALYTPLEQYGDDGRHTDARSDLYAFGATLYHLLTNQPPTDARQRFLHPEGLALPRRINPAISSRTERAILWAMQLHPEDRPESVSLWKEALLGQKDIPAHSHLAAIPGKSYKPFVMRPVEQTLAWVSGALLFVSLIVSLSR